MADNHRNQRGTYRTSNQDWNDNSGRQGRDWDERGFGNGSHDRDFGYSASSSRFGRENDENSSRWDRESGYRGDYGTGRYDRENSGSYGNQDRNYGYGGREYGSSYGGGIYQGNSSYYGSGSSGSGGNSYGESRNLYDRDYEGFNRSRPGNYGNREQNWGEGRGSGGYSNYEREYGRNDYGRNSGRGYGYGNPNERSWWDRTRDEVSSWFGDDDAERRRERDKEINHRGKGPRNYSRSDDRIKEDINDRLSDDPFIDATEIEVTVNGGEVTLTGIVVERSAKRRAEDIAEAVSGVKNVENRLRVGKHEDSSNGGSYRSDSPSQSGVTGTGATVSSEKSKSKSQYVTG